MRGFCAAALVVVAPLLSPIVIAASWAHERSSDVDSYVETVAPLADDEDLRNQLADELGVATVAALEDNAAAGLPEDIDAWAAEAAVAVVRSEGFPEFWREANRDLHREFLHLVHDGTDSDDDPWVQVDVSPLFRQVLDDLEGRGIAVTTLPEIELRIPLVRESTLAEHRDRYLLLEDVARIGPLVIAGLVLLAVVIAGGVRGRLRTAGFAGLGIALGAAVALVAAGPLGDRAAEEAERGRSGLVRLLAEVLIDSFAPFARTILVVALIAGVALLVASLVPVGAGRRAAR